MKKALILSLALLPTVALADTKSNVAQIDKTLEACLENEENQSTAGMHGCYGAAHESYDKLLNKNYKGYVAEFKANKEAGAERLKRLQAAQRAWIAFRDANSQLAGLDMLGGTGEGILIHSTSVEMTKKRVLELAEWLGEAK